MTMGPEPRIRIFEMSVRLGMGTRSLVVGRWSLAIRQELLTFRFYRIGHPANGWSVGLGSNVSLISQSTEDPHTTSFGCRQPRFGPGKKRYLLGSTDFRSKWPFLSVLTVR